MMVPGSRVMLWMNYRQNANGQSTVAVPAPVDPTTQTRDRRSGTRQTQAARDTVIAVPSPVDSMTKVDWWYDFIARNANHFAKIGISDMLFPNPLIGDGAPGSGDDGYNPRDDYDIGSKGTPTRSGTAEKLRRAIAVCRANGINVWLDIVLHQRMGGKGGVYQYKSATGSKNGRFPKHPSCFRFSSGFAGGVAEDPVPDPPNDYPFGDQLCPVNATPKGYVWDSLIAAGDWLFRTTGAQGARLDDMKGMNVGFMNAYMTSGAMTGKDFVGEYDDGNPDNENWWIGQVGQRSSAIDFAFQENMAYPMCMKAGAGDWRMSWMGNNALLFHNAMKAVTFVSSMDSETDGWATIIYNKPLALAMMLGMTGLPLLYIKDWLPASMKGYGLSKEMENLVWCNRNLASGDVDIVYSDAKTFVFRRTGSPGAIIALSNDIWNKHWTSVTSRSGHPAGTLMKDYSGGNTAICKVDAAGNMTFGIPPAADGLGYGYWAPIGHDGAITFPKRSCTQELFGEGGDEGLDIGPAVNGKQVISDGNGPVRLWVEAGSPLTTAIEIDTAGWTKLTAFQYEIVDPAGKSLAGSTVSANAETAGGRGTAQVTGWHTIVFEAAGLPDSGSAFAFKINYTAPQTLTEDQL